MQELAGRSGDDSSSVSARLGYATRAFATVVWEMLSMLPGRRHARLVDRHFACVVPRADELHEDVAGIAVRTPFSVLSCGEGVYDASKRCPSRTRC